MKVTSSKLIQSAGLSAVVAGLLFVAIQPLHPAETLAAVTTSAWANVHYATLVMAMLFVFGLAGIYARQVEETGWLGLIGFLAVSIGFLVQAGFGFVEAFVSPILAASQPDYVQGLLGLVGGTTNEANLGAVPVVFSVTGMLFVGGCLLFGLASLRAGVVSRWASALFGFGWLAVGPVIALLPHGAERLTAVPIGLGLAWLGISLWSVQRKRGSFPVPSSATLQPAEAGAA